MSEPKRSNKSGFQRGFLLRKSSSVNGRRTRSAGRHQSAPVRYSTPVPAVPIKSSTLIEWEKEETPRDTSLLFVSEQNQIAEGPSSVSPSTAIGETAITSLSLAGLGESELTNDRNTLGLVETSSRRRVEILEEESNLDGPIPRLSASPWRGMTEVERDVEGAEAPISGTLSLMSPKVLSNKKASRPLIQIIENDVKMDAVATEAARNDIQSLRRPESHTASFSAESPTADTVATNKITMDQVLQSGPAFGTLNRELAVTLLRLRSKRSTTWGRDALLLVANETLMRPSEHQTFIWSTILDQLLLQRSRLAELRLGVVLWEYLPESILLVLETPDHRVARQRALAFIAILKYWIQQKKSPNLLSVKLLDYSMQQVVSLLTKVALGSNKRTVLTQQTIDIVLELVALAANRLILLKEEGDCSLDAAALQSHIWQNASSLNKLWEFQQQWLNPGNVRWQTDSTCIADECRLIVLSDWRELYTSYQCALESCRMGSSLEMEETKLTHGWCKAIVGYKFLPEGEPIGGLQQGISSLIILSDAEHIVERLERATALGRPGDASSFFGDSRALFRGVLVWLASKKNRILILSSQYRKRIEDMAREFLDHNKYVGALAVQVLKVLWNENGGLPLEISNWKTAASPKSPPKLFTEMIEALSRWCAAGLSSTAPTFRSLSHIVATSFSRLGSMHLREFILEQGYQQWTIAILQFCISNIGKMQEDDRLVLSEEAARLLLEGFEESRLVQDAIRENEYIFQRCSTEMISQGLVQLLSKRVDKEENQVSVGIVLNALMQLLRPEPQTDNVFSSTQSLVTALCCVEGEIDLLRRDTVIRKLCTLIGRCWRQRLLFGTDNDDLTSYGLVLLEIGESMVKCPSSLACLALFGELVEGPSAQTEVGGTQIKRMCFGVKSVLEFSISRLALISSKVSECAADIVFHRLLPFLLLRTVPPSLFKMHIRENVSEFRRKGVLNLYVLLADHVASCLGVDPSSDVDDDYNVNERRLAAEIAGRFMPFGVDASDLSMSMNLEGFSVFHRLFLPSYSRLLENLRDGDAQGSWPQSIRSAKAVLFVVCQYFLHADYSKYGKELTVVASSAIETLLFHPNYRRGSSFDIEHLQSGCIEFISYCIERASEEGFADKFWEVALCRTDVSKEVPMFYTSWNAAVRHIASEVYSILENNVFASKLLSGTDLTGTRPRPDSRFDANRFAERSLRVALWDALLRVAKRAPERSLTEFSKTTGPWILRWGTEKIHGRGHPQDHMCVAVAFETLFLVCTRLQSLDMIHLPGRDTSDGIQIACNWCFRTLQYPEDRDQPEIQDMQEAAVKLLTALITLDKTNSESSVPGRSTCSLKAFTRLYHVIESRPDNKLRTLAEGLLSTVSKTI